jgi:outer membrane lipoprotein-sorting protein
MPFPLPIGQKKATVLQFFRVSRDREAEAKDKKAGRAVLVLVPRKGSPMADQFQEARFWVDPKTGLPTRLRTVDPSDNIITVDVRDIRRDAKVEPSEFARPKVPEDWEIIPHSKPAEAPPPAPKAKPSPDAKGS